MQKKISPETQEQGLKIARGRQKQGQSKEQTKLIAQGIAKGIAEYKKQQSQKSRERDKLQKTKSRQQSQTDPAPSPVASPSNKHDKLPWALLLLSWLAFAAYQLI
jgi:hypothetical protein